MSLSHSHIDVWCARLSAIVDPALLEQYGEMLSPQEREREQRFSLQPARHRFRVARALVRTTLSRYAPVSPERWTFTTSGQGRPEIAECLQPRERLSFNVAHAGDVVVCAVASGRDVGVDIERVVDRSIEPGIADLICAETEKQSLAVLQGMRWQQQFFALWTLKEAYAKARGAGLALPLHECAFEVQAGLATVVMANAPGDAPSRWQFWQLGILRDYVMAVCAERTDVPVHTLSLRIAIPLSGDSSLEWDSLRSSRLSEAGVSEVEWD